MCKLAAAFNLSCSKNLHIVHGQYCHYCLGKKRVRASGIVCLLFYIWHLDIFSLSISMLHVSSDFHMGLAKKVFTSLLNFFAMFTQGKPYLFACLLPILVSQISLTYTTPIHCHMFYTVHLAILPCNSEIVVNLDYFLMCKIACTGSS